MKQRKRILISIIFYCNNDNVKRFEDVSALASFVISSRLIDSSKKHGIRSVREEHVDGCLLHLGHRCS